MSGTRGKCRCRRIVLRLKTGESLAAEFVESYRTSRDRCSRGSHLVRLFRPQNCSAAAHALAETGRVEDDPKLSHFNNGVYLQGDRSTTYAERATDCKLARRRRRQRRVPLSKSFATRWDQSQIVFDQSCPVAGRAGGSRQGRENGHARWAIGAASCRWRLAIRSAAPCTRMSPVL